MCVPLFLPFPSICEEVRSELMMNASLKELWSAHRGFDFLQCFNMNIRRKRRRGPHVKTPLWSWPHSPPYWQLQYQILTQANQPKQTPYNFIISIILLIIISKIIIQNKVLMQDDSYSPIETNVISLQSYKKQMRRKYNKQNGGENSKSLLKRAQSHSHFTLTQNKTLAELNHPSTRHPQPTYHPNRPLRVALPEYFNVPRFADRDLFSPVTEGESELLVRMRGEAELRKKLKDLGVLAEGMRRAKNIKQQSRYYFTQGVFQHNCGAYRNSIASMQKFLKIVLFIRDEKSVELALNAIGAEYMTLGDHQTALEYHRKQGTINERTDLFLSHANCGLCYEMAGDFQSALSQYEEAAKIAQMDPTGTRQAFIVKLIQRTENKKDNVFLTTHQKEPIPEAVLRNNSPRVARTKKSQIVQAIRSAEEHLDKFLSGLKDSFVAEDD